MSGSLVLLAQEGAGGGFVQFLPLILVFLIFYLLVFRPQIKRQKQHQAFLKELKKGDEVVTQGGLLGKVERVTDGIVTLDIGEGTSKVKIRILKSQIMGRLKDAMQEQGEKASAKEEAKPVSSETKPVKE